MGMKKFRITFKGQVYELEVEEMTGTNAVAERASAQQAIAATTAADTAAPSPVKPKASVPTGGRILKAPMPGKIMEIKVKVGDAVKRGDVVGLLEAMKMQNELVAPQDSKVTEIRVSVGQPVATGDVLFVFQ